MPNFKERILLFKAGSTNKILRLYRTGIFSYFSTYENGDVVIKKLFLENLLIISTAALIEKNRETRSKNLSL